MSLVSWSAKKDKEPEHIIGNWQINGDVKKLYDTPFGEVFEFMRNEMFDFSLIYKDRLNNQLNSIQFELFKDSKEEKKMRRYIVLDFKIRTFPAIEKLENPILNFSLTRSCGSADSVRRNRDINGITQFNSGKLFSPIAAGPWSPYWKPPIPRPWSVGLGMTYQPFYSVTSFRFIFDTGKKSILSTKRKSLLERPKVNIVLPGKEPVASTNVNQKKYIRPHYEDFPMKHPARSFGICVQCDPYKPKEWSRTILEISKPQVIMTDEEKDLSKLPLVEIVEYPYSAYGSTNVKKERNPDALYAHAMQLLEGEDLVEGFELLKKVAEKENHIFAMYQLGICYWRGYGVKPDINKAFKWLKRARDFNLAEVYAMYGLLKLRNSPKPYLNPATKNAISWALNKIERYSSKHPNWLMEVMFSNFEASYALSLYKDCSFKLNFWIALETYRSGYYKNQVPAYTGMPPDKLRGLNKPNKFFDIRYMSVLSTSREQADRYISQAIEKNFTPAMYYQGQLLVALARWRSTKSQDSKPDMQKALTLFERGAKLGNQECAIEVLHCKARLGELKPEDFTAERDAQFADHPLYYLLQYMVKNPNAPGVKEFLSEQFVAAREIWRKQPSPQHDFLLGAEGIYQYLHYGFDTSLYMLRHEQTKDLAEAFSRLDQTADKGIIPAAYLSGMYYMTCQRNNLQNFERSNVERGLILMKAAAKGGHPMAQYQLIKYEVEKNKHADKACLAQLQSLRDAKYADAWLLTGDILAKLDSAQRDDVIDAYNKATSFGSCQAWNRLGTLYYKNGKANQEDKRKASSCWEKFVVLDHENRKQDPLDIYWDNIKPPKAWYKDEAWWTKPKANDGLSGKEIERLLDTY